MEGADTPVTRARLAELVIRGRALQALGRRQGPVASVAASLSKLGVTELMFDAAVLEADLAGSSAMLPGGAASHMLADRKTAGEGKRGTVRVALGGRRINK